MVNVKDVEAALEQFGPDLAVETDGSTIVVRAKRFLEKEEFRDVAKLVKEFGGKYKSDGKNSRFVIPLKEEAKATISLTLKGRLQMVIDELQSIQKELK